MERKVKILLVDDHDIVLKGLYHVISGAFPDASVTTEKTGSGALEALESEDFSVVVLDLELQDMSGFDLIEQIRSVSPATRIVVNTMHDEIWNIKRLLHSGVDGIVFKSADSILLVEAIGRVLSGETYYVRQMEGKCGLPEISKREEEVLHLIAEGLSTADIAKKMYISVNTVESHRRHLMEKLGADNAASLVMRAVSLGVISSVDSDFRK